MAWAEVEPVWRGLLGTERIPKLEDNQGVEAGSPALGPHSLQNPRQALGGGGRGRGAEHGPEWVCPRAPLTGSLGRELWL